MDIQKKEVSECVLLESATVGGVTILKTVSILFLRYLYITVRLLFAIEYVNVRRVRENLNMQTKTLKMCEETDAACSSKLPFIHLFKMGCHVIKSTKTHTSSCLGMLNFAIFDLVLAESGLLEGTPLYDLVVSAGNFSFGDSSGA